MFLGRRGMPMSSDRAHRIWRRARLQAPRRGPRRRHLERSTSAAHAESSERGLGLRPCIRCVRERANAEGPHHRRRFTRELLAIDVGGSIRSARVIEVLSKLLSVRGAPRYLRSENGPEFVSRAILSWMSEAKIETALIDLGKPWQNGSNESFNGKFRHECLGLQWFSESDRGEGIDRGLAARVQLGPSALDP